MGPTHGQRVSTMPYGPMIIYVNYIRQPMSIVCSHNGNMMNTPTSTLLVTHTDRDGVLSGAAFLRALKKAPCAEAHPHVLLTQGSFLAFELEGLAQTGERYQSIVVCDTYWHPVHAERISAGFQALLAPGGTLTWIDHHPSSVEGEPRMREFLPGLQSLIRGDREGVHEAVSLVIRHFGLGDDPVADDLLAAAQLRWTRKGEPTPESVQQWLNVIDGLGRTPDLSAEAAATIIRSLSDGFGTPIPEELLPQARLIESCRARTKELAQREWPHLPSVDGGWGLLLDLREEPLAIAYELQWELFQAADRKVDYFVVQESNAVVHYVSGPRARQERDRLEGSGCPHLRVGTHHKGTKGRRRSRFQMGIDLAYMTRRRPAPELLGTWIDAHPYVVKTPWIANQVDGECLRQAGEGIGQAMVVMLTNYGWTDLDRRWQNTFRRDSPSA